MQSDGTMGKPLQKMLWGLMPAFAGTAIEAEADRSIARYAPVVIGVPCR
jgi:hypothetical protein